jgi:hypothetical protein
MKLCRVPNILMFGHCGIHVLSLASALKNHQTSHMSVFEVSAPFKGALVDYRAVFDAVYSLDARDASIFTDLAGLCCQSASRETVRCFVTMTTKLLLFAITAPRKLRGVAQAIYRLSTFHRIQRDFEILHLHFMSPSMADFVRLIPATKRLLVSIWGSDLLRMAGEETYRQQLQICRRASIITIRSAEMREIFLAKFGRELAPKVRIAKLGSPLIPVIAKSDLSALRREIRCKFQLNHHQLLICLGHNGFRENRQIEVLTALENLSDGLKQRLVFIAPMAYGADTEYAKLCENFAKQRGLQLRVLRELLSEADTVRLRAGSDVMIHVPVSDALSGAMCETIFAGNVVVTGSWLPYGEIRRRGVHFCEIDSFAELPSILEFVTANLEQEKAVVRATRERVRDVLDWNNITGPWVQIFAELAPVR